MKKALLVIDLQNDYFERGALPLCGVESALNNTNKLIDYAHSHGIEVYIIKHISIKEGATFFLPNTKGVELHKKLKITDSKLITKYFPNSFRGTSLEESLKAQNIEELIICGAMSHMCVDSTVRAGFDLGYRVTLVEDACATRDLSCNGEVISAKEVHGSFISALGSVFASVVSTQELIDD